MAVFWVFVKVLIYFVPTVWMFELNCNRTIRTPSHVRSPDWTPDTLGAYLYCMISIQTPEHLKHEQLVPKITFNRLSLGELSENGQKCIGDRYFMILDGGWDSAVEPGRYCGSYDQVYSYYGENMDVDLLIVVDSYDDFAEYDISIDWLSKHELPERFGKVPNLSPSLRGNLVRGTVCEKVFSECSRLSPCHVQSPGYPGIYPRNVRCRYYLSAASPHIQLYVDPQSRNLFDVGSRQCDDLLSCPIRGLNHFGDCPLDYVKIYDGLDELSPLIGTFCGVGQFPKSVIGTSKEMFLEFHTSHDGPFLGTGFDLRVDHVPGMAQSIYSTTSCHKVFNFEDLESTNSLEGIIMSLQHWYPPGTNCTYLIQGKPTQFVRVYFPSFQINPIVNPLADVDGYCRESLSVYDDTWPNGMKVIKTFCEFSRPLENVDIISKGNSLLLNFISRTGSYSGSSMTFWAKYDFFDNRHYGELVPGTKCDEVFTEDNPKRYFASPRNTLLFKPINQEQEIRCSYRIQSLGGHARIRITLTNIDLKPLENMKENVKHCNKNQCDPSRCQQMDHIQIVDGSVGNVSVYSQCSKVRLPTDYLSHGPDLSLNLKVNGKTSFMNYFKSTAPLFEARFEFIHPKACGPISLEFWRRQIALPPVNSYSYWTQSLYLDNPRNQDFGPMECVWDWVGPNQNGTSVPVLFTVEAWNLPSSTPCSSFFVEIRSASKSFGQFCVGKTKNILLPAQKQQKQQQHQQHSLETAISEPIWIHFRKLTSVGGSFNLSWKKAISD